MYRRRRRFIPALEISEVASHRAGKKASRGGPSPSVGSTCSMAARIGRLSLWSQQPQNQISGVHSPREAGCSDFISSGFKVFNSDDKPILTVKDRWVIGLQPRSQSPYAHSKGTATPNKENSDQSRKRGTSS